MRETYYGSGMAIYPNTAAGLTVTPGASDAFGSWVELVASASESLFCHVSASGVNQRIRMQIGIGASGSETVVATYLFFLLNGADNAFLSMNLFPFLLIPSGTRVAIRMASSAGGSAPAVTISIGYIPTGSVSNPVLSEVTNPTGAVVSDAGNTALTFKTNLAETTNNYWRDAWVKITSGALINQVKRCTGYDGTSKFITVDGGYTGTPAASVTFEIVNQ